MSEQYGVIAAKVPLEQLAAAITRAWARTADVGPVDVRGIEGVETLLKREQRASGRAGSGFGVRRDGAWSVLLEPSPMMVADSAALAALSRDLGEVLVVWLDERGGASGYTMLAQGRVQRTYTTLDGELTQTGTPRPEEATAAIDDLDKYEVQELLHAFGVSYPYEPEALQSYLWLDPATDQPRPKRPWWKLW